MEKGGADTRRRYSSTSLAATKGKSICGAGSLSLPAPNVPHSQKLCSIKNMHSLSTFAYRSEFFEKITSSITEEVDRGGYRARSLRLAFSLSPSFPLSISLSLTTNIAVYVLLVSDCAVKTPY